MKIRTLLATLLLSLGLSAQALASDYVIDTDKDHAFIEFKIAHLGYSWLLGRFDDFNGTFSYDEKNPSASKVDVTINVVSVDTNHAERDKHLRSADFFDVDKFPQAHFVSTSFKELGNGKAVLKGKFTLRGITRDITINVTHVGHGADPWGGYRRGFEGKTRLKLTDFEIPKAAMLGPAAAEVQLYFSFEGVRQ